MAKLYNLARMTTATTGTGTLTLGSAVAGFLSFAGAGIADGETVTYAIKDGSNSEIGRGVYTAIGTTLSRTVLKSTNSNNAISLSGSAEVFITPAAEDWLEFVNAQTGTTYTIVSNDLGKLVTFSNASSIAVTLPQATGSFAAGWYCDVVNLGAGTVTITPTTSTINGAASLALLTGQGCRIVSDGTNWQINQDVSALVTLTGTQTLTNKTLTSPTINSVNSGPLAGFRNRLINGGMQVWQRATASVGDDTYGFDRWNNLVQTAATTLSQLTDVEETTHFMMRITQGQASAQRFGTAQIIEAANCKDLRGQAVTLSARVRCSNSTTLRYAILEWTGTADSVTSDVVLSWTSTTFTAGNFFLASNLTVTATGSTALTANTLTTVSLSTTLGSSMNNLIVMFWTDSTQAQNSTLDIGKVQLEHGSTTTVFERRHAGTEITLCMRYWQLNGGWAGATLSGLNSHSVAGNFLSPMRTTPTAAVFNGSVATGSLLDIGVAQRVVSSVSATLNTSGGRMDVTTTTNGTNGKTVILEYGSISFDAEL